MNRGIFSKINKIEKKLENKEEISDTSIERLDDINFNPYNLLGKKVSIFFRKATSKKVALIIAVTVFIFCAILPVVWAIQNNTFFPSDAVDYPLFKSYTTWLGDLFLSISIYFSLHFYFLDVLL